MSRWNVKIKDEQHELIKIMADEGKTAKQIAKAINVTQNAVRWHARQHGIKLKKIKPIDPSNTKSKVDYDDYSILPDDILFRHDKTYLF